MLLLKAILIPVRLVISIFTRATKFILNSAAVNKIFAIVPGLFFLGFLIMAWSAIFINEDMPLIAKIVMPCVALLASYITSPLSGALKYLWLLIEKIEGFNNYIKEI